MKNFGSRLYTEVISVERTPFVFGKKFSLGRYFLFLIVGCCRCLVVSWPVLHCTACAPWLCVRRRPWAGSCHSRDFCCWRKRWVDRLDGPDRYVCVRLYSQHVRGGRGGGLPEGSCLFCFFLDAP